MSRPPEPARSGETEDDEETEPDYRFTLANERTFLAWLRTALALLAAGIAVLHLVPTLAVPAARPLLGGLLALLAAATATTGVVRWHRVEHAIRRDRPLPVQRIPWVLAGAMAVLAFVGLVLVAARGIG